ncbi:heptaprenyl diphosphate synthase component II [Chengkuizengella axinellae]|uniref:Heptaprenyl diphosphate synthase component II n=1 Tax=Chengkuizengella axinellae TaxID=3064388 RepID=A0ABT9IWT6_9BACL|nr:heptaprenyl diphosphate synthase component II [Chengkuizengella sp. 2205SS18-9]MDP5273800.1 heptaprenyl diphosphate synthase component II [Chengkuizengella sp. 2205SS18-9]
MKLLDIYARYKKDIQYIESELEKNVHSDHDILKETSIHLLKAGGKRIRPVFVLLSGKFGNYHLENLKNVAVALELIHMATLVHDDVIDNAVTRRGEQTVMAKWDNKIAMYTGDYIFARALAVVTQLKDPEIHQILSKSIVQMCIGEMEQIRDFFNTDQSIRNYLLRIRRKTALLIAISCQLGALAANASREEVRALYSFGYNVGMAFQITDDVLDLCGTEKQIGKPPGSDIKQGNITIPMIYALQESDLKESLLFLINKIKQNEDQSDVNQFIQLIRNSAGIEKAEALANQYIHKAIHQLDQLPDIKTKKHLHDIANFVLSRKY